MAPMFQITGRCRSRLVVPISSSRPRAYSRAMAASIARSRCGWMRRGSGEVSASASSNSTAKVSRAQQDQVGRRHLGEDLPQCRVVVRAEEGEGRDQRAGGDAGDDVELRPGAAGGPAGQQPGAKGAVVAAARTAREGWRAAAGRSGRAPDGGAHGRPPAPPPRPVRAPACRPRSGHSAGLRARLRSRCPHAGRPASAPARCRRLSRPARRSAMRRRSQPEAGTWLPKARAGIGRGRSASAQPPFGWRKRTVRSSGLHAAALACQVVAKATGRLHLPRLESMSRIVLFEGSLAACPARIEARFARRLPLSDRAWRPALPGRTAPLRHDARPPGALVHQAVRPAHAGWRPSLLPRCVDFSPKRLLLNCRPQ